MICEDTDHGFKYLMPGIGSPKTVIKTSELVGKEGYITNTIKSFDQFGGAAAKGAPWKMDTIFLKRK